MVVYTARYVLPVARPPIGDGAVAIDDGRIAAVGGREELAESLGAGVETRDLGAAVVLPGLINAHTHLELSWMGDAGLPEGDFMTWLDAFVRLRERTDEDAAWQAAEEHAEAMRARGTVAVGDVSNDIWIASIVAQSGLHGVVFHELFGFPTSLAERFLAEAAISLDNIDADADVAQAGDRIRIALTPHGAHSTSAPLLKALAGRARAARSPLSVHVAESRAEVEFLANGGGAFRDFLIRRDAWEPDWQPPDHSPVEYLDRLGVLTASTLAVHCVHVNHQDLSKLQARGSTVVTCPRSNHRLGVGTCPVGRILSAGIPVALGTDSRASAPDLDLFREMAALREIHPDLAPAAVLRMATLNGARGLELHDRFGAIAPGLSADLVAVPMGHDADDPLELVTSGPSTVHRLEDAPYEPSG